MIWLLLACATEPVTKTTVGDASLEPKSTREWRRMNIDQLDAAIRVATGGIGWTEIGDDGEEINLFKSLSGSLGKPDYLSATDEDLGPTLLFQKFLEDAATSACTQLVAQEMAGVDEPVFLVYTAGDRVYSQDFAGVQANMRHQLYRLHGRRYSETDPAAEPWLSTFAQVEDAAGTEAAWRTICTALMLHPDFYSY